MLIKANGVEGRLSRFALKILFLRSDSGVKKEDFQMQPVGLDLYKQLKRSYLRISFLFLLTDKICQQSTDYSQQILRMSLHISRVSARIFGQKSTFFGYIFYGFIVVDIMIKSSISSITSGGVSEVLEVSRESVDGLLNKLWFI